MLRTARLTLRPFTLADAPTMQSLAGDREVALNTLTIPHPYPDGAAEEWISTPSKPENHVCAIDLNGQVIGAIGVHIDALHQRAEMGYWVGVPYWGNGYATEAAAAMVGYAFEVLGVNRVFAYHFTRNPSSGRVLHKIGMRREGTLRQHFIKWGEPLDVEFYGIVRADWPPA
jgi:ribosomal-protein-alanine N-acetyltransferase